MTVRIRRALSIGFLATRGRAVAWPPSPAWGYEPLAAPLALELFHNEIRHVMNIVMKLALRRRRFQAFFDDGRELTLGGGGARVALDPAMSVFVLMWSDLGPGGDGAGLPRALLRRGRVALFRDRP